MASHAYNQKLAAELRNTLGFIVAAVSVDAPSLTTGITGTATVAVAGLTPAHKCIVMAQEAASAGGVVVSGAYCAAAGTLTVVFANPTAGTLNITALACVLLAFPNFGV